MKDIYDGASGVRTVVHWDENGADFEYIQRTDQIVDNFQELSSGGHNKSAHGQLAATIPLVTYFEWQREWERDYKSVGVMDFDTFIMSRLNSPDFKKLRNQRL